VHFGDLRFIVNLEDGLEHVCSLNCSDDTTSSDSIVDSLRGLRLDAPGADALMRTFSRPRGFGAGALATIVAAQRAPR